MPFKYGSRISFSEKFRVSVFCICKLVFETVSLYNYKTQEYDISVLELSNRGKLVRHILFPCLIASFYGDVAVSTLLEGTLSSNLSQGKWIFPGYNYYT